MFEIANKWLTHHSLYWMNSNAYLFEILYEWRQILVSKVFNYNKEHNSRLPGDMEILFRCSTALIREISNSTLQVKYHISMHQCIVLYWGFVFSKSQSKFLSKTCPPIFGKQLSWLPHQSWGILLGSFNIVCVLGFNNINTYLHFKLCANSVISILLLAFHQYVYVASTPSNDNQKALYFLLVVTFSWLVDPLTSMDNFRSLVTTISNQYTIFTKETANFKHSSSVSGLLQNREKIIIS